MFNTGSSMQVLCTNAFYHFKQWITLFEMQLNKSQVVKFQEKLSIIIIFKLKSVDIVFYVSKKYIDP